MVYRLATHVEMVEREGFFLMAKAPLRVLRLNDALAGLIRRGGEGSFAATTPGEAAVLEQLALKGFIQPLRAVAGSHDLLPTVSVVIPVKDRAEELGRCLDSLSRIDYPKSLLQVIVVDDGSSDGSDQVARERGAVVLASGGAGRGPAAARNVGAAAASGEILAFIDSDCTASTSWLADLLPAFADTGTAAVGGMVDGMCSSSPVDRYEAVMSSLSLGKRELSGRGGDDTFYLPSCNLLVRRSAFLDAGGFRDEMHVGEDVDLTWRLRDAGWTIRYLPAGSVRHEHRSSIRSFMSRRFDYGTSEGMLQRLHPRRRKRMVIPPLLALLLALCVAAPFTGGWSLPPALLLLAAEAVTVRRRLGSRGVPIGLPALLHGRLRALGSLVYYLSFHLVRYYSIPLMAVGLLFPPVLVGYLAGLCCAARVDFAVRKPEQSFPAFAVIYTLEQLSYGAGVFWGCLRGKTFTSYRVVILRQVVATT